MAAIKSAQRPLQRLLRPNTSLNSLCHRCQALALTDSSSTNLFLASQSQRRYVNIKWGDGKHVPGVQKRKSKRQRLIEAGKKDSLGAPKLTTDELKDVYAPELFVFRSDISSGNLPAAMQTLANLVELEVLRPDDSYKLAQALHYAYRNRSLPRQTLMEFFRIVIHHLKSGELPKHYLASVHILSAFKEAQEWQLGNEYWGWLKEKGVDYLNSRVLGAAIEFLAYQGAPLQDLEKLYELALERFSSSFDAGGGTQHNATSLMLIQGIATARILHQDHKRAYEALDIAARLHPTRVPTRLYELVILNRPVREGYLAFLMACRAGTKMSPSTMMWIMGNWWKATLDAKGMLQLLQAHLAIGGKVGVETLNKIIFALLGRLPEAPEPPAPLGTLIAEAAKEEDDKTDEEKKKEAEEWETWEKKMGEYQQSVNPMFESIRRAIQLFGALHVEPSVTTYCNIISQAARRHLRSIVAAAMREIEGMVRSGKGRMDETSYRVLLGAYGSLADQDGVKKVWEGMMVWRTAYLKDQKKVTDGRTWTGQLEKKDGRDHELISWKALIRAGFEAGLKPYILEQLQKYQSQFGDRLTQEIRLEIVRCEGRLQKTKKQDAEMLATAVKTGEDSIATSGNAATLAQQPRLVISTTIPNTGFKELKAEVEEYSRMLDVIEKVIRSPVAYDFSTLELDLEILGLPEMTEDDMVQLKEVYEHFQRNMPRNPFVTATNDPKTDFAGLQKTEEARREEGNGDGSWGEGRSITGYSVNQLRFENWITVNRLLYLAERSIGWRERNMGVKGVTHGLAQKERNAREAIKKVEGLEGKQWEDEVLNLRMNLIGEGAIPEGKLPDSLGDAFFKEQMASNKNRQ